MTQMFFLGCHCFLHLFIAQRVWTHWVGFKSWLFCVLILWTWVHFLTFLVLSFLIYKTGDIIVPYDRARWQFVSSPDNSNWYIISFQSILDLWIIVGLLPWNVNLIWSSYFSFIDSAFEIMLRKSFSTFTITFFSSTIKFSFSHWDGLESI